MKTNLVTITSFLFFSIASFAQEKQQEVLLMGTMHTVPKIVKKSYKPMLRYAKKYNPQAIYVESPMADDSLSWEYLKTGWSKGYQKFYKLSDSLQKSFDFNETKFNQILSKEHSAMTQEELTYLINSFIYKRDNGNYEYYSYIKKYGLEGANKPTRHEDGDLTYKLALKQGHKLVFNMDDQQTNGEYHNAWQKCVKEGRSNGNNVINNKLNKKSYNSAMIPAVFRGLGRHTNKRKSVNRLHSMSSFGYVIQDTPGCEDGRRYWNERNSRMADNIAKQILASNNQRNIVIVGAAHIIGLEEALKAKYPNLKVKLAYE
jgi:hypothetical protein